MTWNNKVSVWKQRHYDGPLRGQRARQGRGRQPSVCARSIWMTLHNGRYIGTDRANVELFFNILTAWTESFFIPWDQLLYPCDVQMCHLWLQPLSHTHHVSRVLFQIFTILIFVMGRRVIGISRSLMELIFNPCGEFWWRPEGPVS